MGFAKTALAGKVKKIIIIAIKMTTKVKDEVFENYQKGVYKKHLLEAVVDDITQVLNKGHGGGNWRRLLHLLRSKYEDKIQKS